LFETNAIGPTTIGTDRNKDRPRRAAGRIAKPSAYSGTRGRCKPRRGLARCNPEKRGGIAMILPVTLVIAAACGVVNIWLALRLVRGRVKNKVMIGDGGDSAMVSGMRAHGNFIEYAPIVLILMALIELARGPLLALGVMGAVFVLARIAHPLGMTRPAPNAFRAGGAMATWVVTLLLAGWALAIAVDAGGAGATTVVPIEAAPRA
jgi:uncharacterized membrane protein YecN with MAPEG domain